jgi:hypothetical protein
MKGRLIRYKSLKTFKNKSESKFKTKSKKLRINPQKHTKKESSLPFNRLKTSKSTKKKGRRMTLKNIKRKKTWLSSKQRIKKLTSLLKIKSQKASMTSGAELINKKTKRISHI